MKSPETSLRVFAIYLILIPGFGLMIIPEYILDLFQFSHGGIFWMARMIGFLAFALGIYYLYMAKYKLVKIYKITVVLRFLAAAFMVGLWLTGEVEIMILLFAAPDALAATWTSLTIRS
jgi:hypothetical protein